MTDKQKEAIKILNRFKDSMTNEEYFLLMEFVIENESSIQYSPYITHEQLHSKARQSMSKS